MIVWCSVMEFETSLGSDSVGLSDGVGSRQTSSYAMGLNDESTAGIRVYVAEGSVMVWAADSQPNSECVGLGDVMGQQGA
ncbi:hypothetical protein NDU88_008169 [Pleurodeles waltl]|uniref:Uncharacterized protein n=1 Tax=Pleurodeles waltl TaxID=8319 RepID=A0AAV7QMU9_PLEWA|nr:hypothetical protein NDU88_008169 [Pleurodeles waltl]